MSRKVMVHPAGKCIFPGGTGGKKDDYREEKEKYTGNVCPEFAQIRCCLVLY
jgi:hypothetical protein